MTLDTSIEQRSSSYPDSDRQLSDGEPVFLELEDSPPEDTPKSEPPDQQRAGAGIPGWFRRKRARSAGSQASAGAIAASVDRDSVLWKEPGLLDKLRFLLRRHFSAEANWSDAENPHYERFEQFARFAISGSGISLIVHALLLCVLALIVVSQPETDAFNLVASESSEEVIELDEIDTRLEKAGAKNQELTSPQFTAVEALDPQFLQPEPLKSTEIKASSSGSGEGATEGDGGRVLAVPDSGNVVVKGSFTAWTLPEDPRPGQSYVIVIQVDLPDDTKRYNSRDLSGMVVGTDGYRQTIPGVRRIWLPVEDNRAQFKVFVPGAERLVKDTINIRSRRLKEKQTLEIVF